jgi:iron(III) transport system ATP-binding protein
MTDSQQNERRGVVIDNLSLSFGRTEVLKGVNLHITEGEFFAFLGPSGSGKSTLLRAVAGFGPKPRGRILINGQDIAGLPPWKRDVGMVFQSYALWPHLTVRRNVAFGLEERRVSGAETTRRVDEALDLVGLRHLAERRPSQLSGGQQQRIALARTIVVRPQVLLLDEPLSNLDANLRIQMRREIRDLQQQMKLTTIFVTHDQEEANTTSDRMAVLDNGIIQQVGAPMELYDQPANLFVARFLGTANVLAENGGHLVFRPQAVAIAPAGTPPPAGGGHRLYGKVRHLEFLGSIIRYGVEVDGNLILVDDPHRKGQPTHAVASEVILDIPPEQVTLLPGERM